MIQIYCTCLHAYNIRYTYNILTLIVVIFLQEKGEKTKASQANWQCQKSTGSVQRSLWRIIKEKSSSWWQSKHDETFA